MITWFLNSGMVKLNKADTKPRENTPLYHVTGLFRYNVFFDKEIRRILANLDFNDKRGEVSHDNMVAMYTYLAVAKDITIDPAVLLAIKRAMRELEIWPKYKHPRDALYIAMLQNRWWFWLLFPLWYLAFMIMFLYMGVRKYKYRDHGTFYKTDTEILYWIRLQLPKRYFLIHMSKPFIVPLMKWKFGKDWVQGMMDRHYLVDDHPNRRLLPEIHTARIEDVKPYRR